MFYKLLPFPGPPFHCLIHVFPLRIASSEKYRDYSLVLYGLQLINLVNNRCVLSYLLLSHALKRSIPWVSADFQCPAHAEAGCKPTDLFYVHLCPAQRL